MLLNRSVEEGAKFLMVGRRGHLTGLCDKMSPVLGGIEGLSVMLTCVSSDTPVINAEPLTNELIADQKEARRVRSESWHEKVLQPKYLHGYIWILQMTLCTC